MAQPQRCCVLCLLELQIKKECLTCRNALALFDMSYFGKFYLVGPEATKAADWLFSADVSKAPGTASAPPFAGEISPQNNPEKPRLAFPLSAAFAEVLGRGCSPCPHHSLNSALFTQGLETLNLRVVGLCPTLGANYWN